ncbi:MAG: hypothetical protein M3281_06345, partial [Chloroflexota bacterium]|nr:hypothetical protein [Chloroflexota bacterium]
MDQTLSQLLASSRAGLKRPVYDGITALEDRRSTVDLNELPDLRKDDRGAFRSGALIVNARSRLGERKYERALELLREWGVPLTFVQRVDNPRNLCGAVDAALQAGHDLIVIGGGDGTVSSAVGAIAHRRAVLGVLPLGTANDFARTLQIPFNLRSACETIARG